jgi:hypothetical protein
MKNLYQIIKTSAAPNAKYAPASKDGFKYGESNEKVSLPIDYHLVGFVNGEIRVGGQLTVTRIERNGVQSFGIFSSSVIENIKEDKKNKKLLVSTGNSIYELTKLKLIEDRD